MADNKAEGTSSTADIALNPEEEDR